jgi:hypothetical protein
MFLMGIIAGFLFFFFYRSVTYLLFGFLFGQLELNSVENLKLESCRELEAELREFGEVRHRASLFTSKFLVPLSFPAR